MKASKLFLALSCLFSSFVSINQNRITQSLAAESEQEKILTTNPFEDLVEDEQFKTDYLNGVYKFDETKETEFLNFAEYKFENQYTESYGLYIYFYNPNQHQLIKLLSEKNKIELSTNGVDYKKYSLTPISKSVGEIANLFYKFRVNTDEEFYNSLNSSERTYYLSSFELEYTKSPNVTDVEIGTTFKYTGYAKGCNGNDESTLQCYKEGLETIHLKVYGGTKRSGMINSALTEAIDLHYAYFEIPNKYIESYGEPYAVSYEYYDAYLDKGIFNIDKNDYYFDAKWWQKKDGRECASYVDAYDPFIWSNQPLDTLSRLWEITYPDVESVVKGNKFSQFDARPTSNYNPKFIEKYPDYWVNDYSRQERYYYKDHLDRYKPDVLGERVFRKDNWNSEISGAEIENKINELGLDYFSTNVKYSGVITSTIDDIQPPADIEVGKENYNWWLELIGNATTNGTPPWGRTQDGGETWSEKAAFELIETRADVNGNNHAIDKNDVEQFNNIFDKTDENDTSLCILRFSETEYWSAPIYFVREAKIWGGTQYEEIGYSAFMHVIEGFDILSLTFKMNDEYRVIPVVSDPIRIVPGVTPPPDDRPEQVSWWKELVSYDRLNIKLIIGIVAGVILIFLTIKLIVKIINLFSTKRALKANKIIIDENKKKKRGKNKSNET